MRSRIQRSISVILLAALLLFYVIFAVILYEKNLDLLKNEVRQEAMYICAAIRISGFEYLEEMDHVEQNTRVTWIAEDGEVLYDSLEPERKLSSHASRAEFQAARKTGRGEDIRVSDTVRRELYYYAVRMEDGTVLRVAKSMDSLTQTALDMFPVMGGITLIMMIAAIVLSRWQTQRLIEPINDLDLEHPLDNDVYEELTPLLESMDIQNREKEAMSNMRKEFSANVSHELKTPLTSISGYAEIMKNGMVRPSDVPVFAERIYKEARRLITLVEDIIKLSKLDEESVELEKEMVNLYDLTREIVSRLSHQAAQKNVHLEVTGEVVMCNGIRQILDEMIYNICENAIKYNVDGGSVTAWVGSTLEGAKISVRDTGIGIPPEHHDRIFERFYRVDKSHSQERTGTGLGLSIVKHGALLHGAKVTVESAPGNGTHMEILFPKTESEQEANRAFRQSEKH